MTSWNLADQECLPFNWLFITFNGFVDPTKKMQSISKYRAYRKDDPFVYSTFCIHPVLVIVAGPSGPDCDGLDGNHAVETCTEHH